MREVNSPFLTSGEGRKEGRQTGLGEEQEPGAEESHWTKRDILPH